MEPGESGGYRLMMRDLATSEKPRERLQNHGASALSNAELLAIMLRVGVGGESALALAHRLLSQFHGLAGLACATLDELCTVRGVGPTKAVQIKAALELGKRLLLEDKGARPQIQNPADAANLLLPDMSLLEQEQMRVLLLDTKHFVLDASTVYQGSLNTSVIRIGELFREAIRRNCAAIIVAHNHPSGDPTPSPEDISVTSQVTAAGKLLDIEVLDHLIIGQHRYVSLRERGLGFS